jgi:hypothetical protein
VPQGTCCNVPLKSVGVLFWAEPRRSSSARLMGRRPRMGQRPLGLIKFGFVALGKVSSDRDRLWQVRVVKLG